MQHESAVLVVSDLHYGKRTPNYDPDIFRKRMDQTQVRLLRLQELLSPTYNLEELVIVCLGDVNDGTDIYATQAHYQAITNVEEQANQLATYLRLWTCRLKDTFPAIRWECVAGNHGRAGKFASEGANWDMVAYRYLGLMLEKEEVPVNVPAADSDPFRRQIQIRKHDYIIYHGQDIPMYLNIPYYGAERAAAAWSTMTEYQKFSTLLLGHFHTFAETPMNDITVLFTGTLVTGDIWAERRLRRKPSNKWHLFGVSNKRPLTWRFGVELT